MRPHLALALAATLLGCTTTNGSGTGTGATTATPAVYLPAADITSLCTLSITTCKSSTQTMAQCGAALGAYRVTQTCISAVEAATCPDLTGTNTALDQACFPPCASKGVNTCESDGQAIQECSSAGALSIIDCTKACATASQKFTGKCGGTCVNSSNQPACCCQ